MIFKKKKKKEGRGDFKSKVIDWNLSCISVSLLKYITSESTLRGENIDTTVTPEKALMDREKELLEKVKVRSLS